MQTGYLKFTTSTASRLIPVAGAKITVSENGNIIAYRVTDKSGASSVIAVEAPDKNLSESPGNGIPYASLDAEITKEGFRPLNIKGIQVFAGETSVLNADLIPEGDNFNLNGFNEYNIKPQNL